MADLTKPQLEEKLKEALETITKLTTERDELGKQDKIKAERIAQLEDELKTANRVIGELRANPLVKVVESPAPLLDLKEPAPAGVSEAEITEKVRAGLARKQAIEVIMNQRREDAEAAKASKK